MTSAAQSFVAAIDGLRDALAVRSEQQLYIDNPIPWLAADLMAAIDAA